MWAPTTARAVVVTHPTELELLMSAHGTLGQVRFFLQTRDQQLDEVRERHERHEAALRLVKEAVPKEWRRVTCLRSDLDRFLFEPQDVVVVVGRDGLVANVAKYLAGQLVIGVNPDPGIHDGVLVRTRPEETPELLRLAAESRVDVEERTMVEASLDGVQQLRAVNELFVGHRSHQTARYDITTSRAERAERQLSSGVIVSTGTGATGWALAINRGLSEPLALPRPEAAELAYFVREPFPSLASGTALTRGLLGPGDRLELVSRMDGGVVFGDGIEADRLEFNWGRRLAVKISDRRLRLAC